MDQGLEQLVKAFKQIFNLKEKDVERIEEQVSYLQYGFYDLLENHEGEKISMDSLILFFGYLFGSVIEDDDTLETFISIIKAVYITNKIKKENS